MRFNSSHLNTIRFPLVNNRYWTLEICSTKHHRYCITLRIAIAKRYYYNIYIQWLSQKLYLLYGNFYHVQYTGSFQVEGPIGQLNSQRIGKFQADGNGMPSSDSFISNLEYKSQGKQNINRLWSLHTYILLMLQPALYVASIYLQQCFLEICCHKHLFQGIASYRHSADTPTAVATGILHVGYICRCV